jgi:hypothetical protein
MTPGKTKVKVAFERYTKSATSRKRGVAAKPESMSGKGGAEKEKSQPKDPKKV